MRPVRNVFQKLSRTEQRREGVVAYLCLTPSPNGRSMPLRPLFFFFINIFNIFSSYPRYSLSSSIDFIFFFKYLIDHVQSLSSSLSSCLKMSNQHCHHSYHLEEDPEQILIISAHFLFNIVMVIII
jgi:hypothetical protein